MGLIRGPVNIAGVQKQPALNVIVGSRSDGPKTLPEKNAIFQATEI